MRIIKCLNNKIKIYEVVEMLFLLLLGLYLAFLAEKTTTYSFVYTVNVERYLLIALKITSITKLILFLVMKKQSIITDGLLRRKLLGGDLSAIALWVVYYMVYRSDKYIFLLFLGYLVIGSVGSSYKKILKTYVISVGLIVGSAVLASLSGFIYNYVNIRKGQVRSSWGIICTSDYASIVVFLCITAWIAWDNISLRFFFFIGVATALNAAFIAKSSTSTITSVVFLMAVVIEALSIKKGKSCIALLLEICFPFFALSTFIIEYLYHKGTTIGIKIDDILHGRFEWIDNGFRNYKLSLFGTPFAQIGNGGSVIHKSNYNFIDSTYVLVLLRYGVVLFVLIMILWILMTRKAVRMGDWRLAFGLGIIAFHSFSEHHFPEVNYNIFIILPFSVLGMEWLENNNEIKTVSRDSKRFFIGFLIAGGMSVLTLSVGPKLLSLLRTIFDVTEDIQLKNKNQIVCAGFVIVLILLIITLIALYKLLIILCYGRNKGSLIKQIKLPLSVLGIIVLIFVFGIRETEQIVDKRSALLTESIKNEKNAINAVKSGIKISRGHFYVDESPYLYKKIYGDVTDSFFQGDELADIHNVTVLMDANYESLTMMSMGFLFTEISDDHALYSNDDEVIKRLSAAGYQIKGYYSRKRQDDIRYEAGLNNLKMTTDGAVKLVGREGSLISCTYNDLFSGKYTVTYELSLPEIDIYKEDYKICTLRVTKQWGTEIIKEMPVYRRDFDSSGDLNAKISFAISGELACEFKVFVEEGQSVLLKGVFFQKTPELDIRYKVDKKGRTTWVSYYDLEGNKIEISDGYHAVKYEYDKDNNIKGCWYYDINNELVIIKNGYSGIRKKYDARKRILKESYYDQDGSKLTLESGQAAVSYGYDQYGNTNEYKYYDINDNLTMISKGYAILRRTFDNKGRIVREAYYDTNDAMVMISNGYAEVRFDYDEDGHEYNRRYYDEKCEPVVSKDGFAERHRIYDINGNVIIEEYYGSHGELIALNGGEAIVEYEYDMYGNKANIYYYDINTQPVMYNNAYYHLYRVYNEKNQVIKEETFDTECNPILQTEGYVIEEREYDEYGNAIIYRYYDADGNPQMRTDGFFERKYTFNDKKQIIKTEYYDVFGKPVLLTAGYSKVEYEYDDLGNETDLAYYDTEGAPAIYWGLYYKVHRYFNDNRQIIREEYLDGDGCMMTRIDGFAMAEREYDLSGNMIEERYIGLDGKLSLNSKGYAIIRREYDSSKRIVKEYYLGTDSKPVDSVNGYSTAEYSYNMDGSLSRTVYYNANGEVVE